MRRWLISGTVAIVALLLVMVALRREPDRRSQASRNKSRTSDVEPSVPVEKKPAPMIPDNPTAHVDPIQTAPSLNQPTESELELAAKKPAVYSGVGYLSGRSPIHLAAVASDLSRVHKETPCRAATARCRASGARNQGFECKSFPGFLSCSHHPVLLEDICYEAHIW